MTYELVKKLKEAGFKRKEGEDGITVGEMEKQLVLEKNSGDVVVIEGEPIYCPTLEELIEACGKDFGRLQDWSTDDGERWVAESRKMYEYIPDSWSEEKKEERKDTPEHSYITVTGSSPEEAVANLWLALNREKKVI